jgi:hypothetical protein
MRDRVAHRDPHLPEHAVEHFLTRLAPDLNLEESFQGQFARRSTAVRH